jgi:hypothetical protein
MCLTKRKAGGELAEAPLPKHGKTEAPLPKHGKRLFIRAILHRVNEYGKNRQCEGNFLVDSGCTGAIMNSEFVVQHKLPWVRRPDPVKVTGADGTPIEGAGERHTKPLTMRIGYHQEEISWEIGQLEKGISGYLPIEWLTKHNPEVAGARKANSGLAGEAAGAEECGPAGEAAGADIEWHDEEGGNIADQLPEMYRDWASVFSEEEINCLPDHTEYDHRIEVVEGAVSPFGPIYPLSEKELQALREYLRKELAAGKIRRSKSPAAGPIIEEEINRLPDHAECDHHIELVECMVPPFGPVYSLSDKELQTPAKSKVRVIIASIDIMAKLRAYKSRIIITRVASRPL